LDSFKKMGKQSYSYHPGDNVLPHEQAKSSGKDVKSHYKQTSEVGRAIKGLKLKKAQTYLERVINKKDVIPYMVHKGGKGRHPMAKLHKTGGSGFPLKASQEMLKLLKNAEENFAFAYKNEHPNDSEGLEKAKEKLVLKHVQVNRAARTRRRTFRAHGRIGAYMKSPCHIQLVAQLPSTQNVPVPPQPKIISRKWVAIQNRLNPIPEGGGETASSVVKVDEYGNKM
jgi:large subunit ribosomal protein L17e